MQIRLKYWRTRRAMSIDDLAGKSGTSTQTIVNAEKHGKTPRPSTIRKWATALDVTVDELVKVEEEEEKPAAVVVAVAAA